MPAQYNLSKFRKLTADNGLSDNLVNSIVQDDRGFIWVATSNGLNRFDGHQFNLYRAASGLLSGSNIRLLKKFSRNRIGVLTTKGFTVIDAGKVSGTSYTVPDSTTLWFDMNQVMDAAELPGGGFAFTSATGFYTVDGKGRFTSRYEHFSQKDKTDNTKRIFFGNTIFPVSDQEYLLYYQDSQLGSYNLPGNSFTTRNPELYRRRSDFLVPETNWTIKKQVNSREYLFLSFARNEIRYFNPHTNTRFSQPLPFEAANFFYWDSYIHFINDSLFSINCHRNGFYLFTLDRAQQKIILHPRVQLPGVECRNLFTDRDGRLWIATTEGLLMEQKSNPDFAWQYTTGNEGEDAEYFNTSICKTGNRLFVGRYAYSNGLLVYDADTDSLVRRINFFNGNNRYNGVVSLQTYYPDTVWVSTENGPLWVNSRNYSYGKLQLPGTITGENIRFYPKDRNGVAWLLNYFSNEVARLETSTRTMQVLKPGITPGFPAIRPKFIAIDSDGDTWIAGNGLCRWNHKTKRIDTVIKKFAGQYPLEERVTGMIADDRGGLWLTTIENGMLHYRIREKHWTAFAEKDGLPGGVVGTFSPFVKGGFWFSAVGSIFSLAADRETIDIRPAHPELPKNNMTSENNHYYYDTLNDRMYIAVRNILSRFRASINTEKKLQPVILKEIVINNRLHVHFPGDTIYLDHTQSQVAIHPGMIDFENINPPAFKYSINGGTEYDLSLQNPVLLLDKLQPGNYRITIAVRGAAGTTRSRTIVLSVKPPFWKTAWFYAGVVTAASALLFALYRVRIRNIRRKALLNQHLAEFEMKALHAQMNPHFIFNCLNSIKGLIVNNQNTEASQYLNKFSLLVRKNLDHSRSQFITLKENIDYLRHYIDIENYRFGNIRYSIDTGTIPDTEDIFIAPMLLQPLVENAVWHGLRETDREIRISFYPEGNKICCRIEDNGIGIIRAQQLKPEGSGNSVGLSNIRERISLLNQKFGLEYSLTIRDRSDIDPGTHGTLVLLHFKSK